MESDDLPALGVIDGVVVRNSLTFPGASRPAVLHDAVLLLNCEMKTGCTTKRDWFATRQSQHVGLGGLVITAANVKVDAAAEDARYSASEWLQKCLDSFGFGLTGQAGGAWRRGPLRGGLSRRGTCRHPTRR